MPTEIILSRSGGEIWIAVKEDGRVAELLVDREGHRSLVGNVYKGRVSRVVPGMQAAFVDVGLDKDAFLHVGDLPQAGHRVDRAALAGEPGEEDGLEEDAASGARAGQPADIRDCVRQGQTILVQVSKDPLGTKGARVTGIVTLAGRALVLLPEVAHVGLSRRIEDAAERERLRTAVLPLAPPGGGFIVRTAGEGTAPEALRAEADTLLGEWAVLRERAEAARAPALVRRETDLPIKVLRDRAGASLARIAVDDEGLAEACRELLRRSAPELLPRLVLHEGPAPLLDEEGLGPVIEGALRARVWLKSGGYLVISPTEALVAIDVNSGRYLAAGNLEDTALRINLEAVREVARQLRLRDLGGIVVVDCIDMQREESRRRLLEEMEEALRPDRARARLVGLAGSGLLVLTRKRTRPSLERALGRPCPYCSGRGRIRSAATVAGEVARALRRRAGPGGRVRLRVHPEVADELGCPGSRWLERAAAEVEVEADAALHREAFELTGG